MNGFKVPVHLTEHQIYLGEHLSQDDFFKKIKDLEVLGDKLNREMRKAGLNNYHNNNTNNPYMKLRQDMLENLLK